MHEVVETQSGKLTFIIHNSVVQMHVKYLSS